MRILQLSPRLPYPLFDGGVISVFKVAMATASLGHHVTFVTYSDPDPVVTEDAKNTYKGIVQLELTDKPLPSMFWTLVKTVFRGAYPIERRMMPEMFSLIERIMTEGSYDIVHIDHAHMGKYGLWMKKRYDIPVVLREHNYETLLYERYASNERNPLKKIVARIHGKRLKTNEAAFFRELDAVIPITLQDEDLMRREVPEATYRTIPAGVDLEDFSPSSDVEIPNSILWVGGINWRPNLDALEFFVKEILPRIVSIIPDVTFDVVGDSTDRLQHFLTESAASIKLHGRVPDIRPFMAKSAVMICPLRVGGGMRLKLLDFFAAGKAVVSTRIGAEGNLARDEYEILLRDSATDFAQAVVELLQDRTRRARLGRNARALVEREYSWESIGERFCAVYKEVIDNKRRR